MNAVVANDAIVNTVAVAASAGTDPHGDGLFAFLGEAFRRTVDNPLGGIAPFGLVVLLVLIYFAFRNRAPDKLDANLVVIVVAILMLVGIGAGLGLVRQARQTQSVASEAIGSLAAKKQNTAPPPVKADLAAASQVLTPVVSGFTKRIDLSVLGCPGGDPIRVQKLAAVLNASGHWGLVRFGGLSPDLAGQHFGRPVSIVADPGEEGIAATLGTDIMTAGYAAADVTTIPNPGARSRFYLTAVVCGTPSAS